MSRRFHLTTQSPVPDWWIDKFNVNQDLIRYRIRQMLARGRLTVAEIRYILFEFDAEQVDYALASMVLDQAATSDDGKVFRIDMAQRRVSQ